MKQIGIGKVQASRRTDQGRRPSLAGSGYRIRSIVFGAALKEKESIVKMFLGVHTADESQDVISTTDVDDDKENYKSTLKRYHNE